ncbi:MAG: glutathione S-transferase N-terminal domain-containing protein, partial [Synechocystis sp.]|nr:glutathione S-transferase N-terminal domain-containing protein [Synechocystis sp.]
MYNTPLSWPELEAICDYTVDAVNGPTNAQATLRLFGQPEEAIRVTLYRDNHAWCPYCQKVWLWLEEKQIPYRVKKVTMFCYGEKEAWYKKLVPSGMLPALELDGQFYT